MKRGNINKEKKLFFQKYTVFQKYEETRGYNDCH